MEIKIREIIEDDYAAVASMWNNELGYGNVSADTIASHMARMNVSEHYKTLVAISENNVIGFIAVVEILAFEFDIGYLKVDALAVRENCQKQGVGTSLLKYAENYAIKKGLTELLLNSGFQRANAHMFYERYGFEKKSYCFRKKI